MKRSSNNKKELLKVKEEIKFPRNKGLMHLEESLFISKKYKKKRFFLFEHGEEPVLEDSMYDCIEIINVCMGTRDRLTQHREVIAAG